MTPRRRAQIKRAAVWSFDPKMWALLLTTGLSWWNSDGKIQKQKYDEGTRYTVVVSQVARLELRADSLKTELARLRKIVRRKGGFVVAADTVAVAVPQQPGLARRFLSALWSPF